MRVWHLVAASVCCCILAASSTAAPQTGATIPSSTAQQLASVYRSLPRDTTVGGRQVLIAAHVTLARTDSVLVESDGDATPVGAGADAELSIEVDGRRVSNVSAIDWRQSVDPVELSYDAVGAAQLSAGTHTVDLIGDAAAGTFSVPAGANLSVFVHPAPAVQSAAIDATAGPFDFTTLGDVGPDLPHTPLASIQPSAAGALVALGSADSESDGHDGDAMLGLYLDGSHPGPASSMWTTSDTCTCAETTAPQFTQALLNGTPRSTVSLDATEFPWTLPGPASEDPAIYAVPQGGNLVVLSGLTGLSGRADSVLPYFADQRGTVSDVSCVASTPGWPGCPSIGTNVLLARTAVYAKGPGPAVVMFTAKTREQGDGSDAGGTAKLWITVDGVPRGSTGVQQLVSPFSVSQRPITASYLAAGANALAPGLHTIAVYGRADGSFVHLAYLRDLPLVWFG